MGKGFKPDGWEELDKVSETKEQETPVVVEPSKPLTEMTAREIAEKDETPQESLGAAIVKAMINHAAVTNNLKTE
jgi:hypothetical protein